MQQERNDSAREASHAAEAHFVRFINVQKSYDGIELVVKGFDLDIHKGEFVTLLGPSGSGKTTCLMMMAGFETPTHGQILLKGEPINDLPPHKRGIGMVFQNYALFPHMSVAENLAFPLEVRHLSKAEIKRKVARALAMVRLENFGDRRPAQLSGGQQQRVALARALVFEPELVLMDEPLGALDKNLREEMQYEIKRIHAELGVSMIYVTHDQTEALTMSDRIAVFNDGVVQQLAAPETLYEAPENAFVANFIGENNRLYGEVTEMIGDKCQVRLDSGETVLAKPVAAGGIGARTTLSLRPERVDIVSSGAEETFDNRFRAEVREVIYLGDHLRTRVSVCGNEEFILKTPNAKSYASLRPGQSVDIGWSSSDCRALDA
ncbi:ABC transporter ATP-binding protein [Halomonas daqingensis]|uniref:Spermidine/putrescine import ATP-binding protein PotA n=1 Tax=Billgrantia desiderata TaxID=52021 RepID=A0AAW4YPE9_9GAMM|nr:ABC transporter ATP-binding protein [Halomonas desiderata]OUE37204.1 spermidine/putrescine ABC transporter ATP-binding protein [Halomonas desiderata SP1]MCE8028476.1 ABC transporter ATP-binding protein [Halomonas desiderata]MCE8044657.1 ABC transporter ATP-binding protein [Halomonas desiderata]MCE8049231.1 ABC transporter ATP-binding protein [Halomonas desiderata]